MSFVVAGVATTIRALTAKTMLTVRASFKDGTIGGWQRAPMDRRQINPHVASGEYRLFFQAWGCGSGI